MTKKQHLPLQGREECVAAMASDVIVPLSHSRLGSMANLRRACTAQHSDVTGQPEVQAVAGMASGGGLDEPHYAAQDLVVSKATSIATMLAKPVNLRLALRAFKHASTDAKLSAKHDKFVVLTDLAQLTDAPVDGMYLAKLFTELSHSPLATIEHGEVTFHTTSPAPVRAAWLTGPGFTKLGIVVNVGSIGEKTVRLASKSLKRSRMGDEDPPAVARLRNLRNPSLVMRYLTSVAGSPCSTENVGVQRDLDHRVIEAISAIQSTSDGMAWATNEILTTIANTIHCVAIEVHDDGRLTQLTKPTHAEEALIWHRRTGLLWWGEGPSGAPAELLLGPRWLSHVGIVQHMRMHTAGD
jgi:hypothetical protein